MVGVLSFLTLRHGKIQLWESDSLCVHRLQHGIKKKIEVDNEKAARINTDDGEDDDEAQRLLEESLFAEPEEIELDDEDFEDFKAWENNQEEEGQLWHYKIYWN